MHVTALLGVFAGAFAEQLAADSVVGLGFKKVTSTLDRTGLQASLRRRQLLAKRGSTMALDVENELTMYQVTIEVGTPAQNMTVILDTGSSDLWVMDASNPYCGTSIDCSGVSTFDNSSSSTFSENSTVFSITYGDGSAASGYFCQDTVTIAGNAISKANFAVAAEANTSDPVFGIGPRYGEATATTVSSAGEVYPTYDNILISMKEQGYIQSLSFSLWLNDINSNDGQVLFGGVDTTKFSGDLTKMPIIRELSGVELEQAQAVNVQLTGVGLYNSDGKSALVASGGTPALLDSGTSLTYLPNEWLEAIGTSLGATYSETIDMYIVECDLAGGVVFELAGTQFQVPFAQMIYSLTSGSDQATDQNGNSICGLGIMESGAYADEATVILGETFLRGVYVVYDYDNWEVGVAPAEFNVTSSSVSAISSSISGTAASAYSSTDFVSSFSTGSVSLFGSSESVDQDATYAADSSGGVPGVSATSKSESKTAGKTSATSGASGSSGTSGSGSASSNAAFGLSVSPWLMLLNLI